MAAVVGWLGRQTLLYILLVLAIIVGTWGIPLITAEWQKPRSHLATAQTLEAVKQALEQDLARRNSQLNQMKKAARTHTVAQILSALAKAESAKRLAIGRRKSGWEQMGDMARADPQAILETQALEMEIRYFDAEIAVLRAALDRTRKGVDLINANQRLQQVSAQYPTLETEKQACDDATRALEEFKSRLRYKLTFGQWDRDRRAQLENSKNEACANYARYGISVKQAAKLLQDSQLKQAAAQRAYSKAQQWTSSALTAPTAALDRRIARERAAADGSLRARFDLWWKQIHGNSILAMAVGAYVLIKSMPYLIRLICYYMLAPIAMRRPAIALSVPGGAGPDILPAEPSTTSVSIRIAPHEELLVRQDYLQTSSVTGEKRTQLLMDWRAPVMSLVTGLYFLTRIRGTAEPTTISAVQDALAEVTVLTLPQGAACVVQPRIIAAVVKPIEDRLRIQSQWRLFTLNAWLTMQLRYVIFHGPARLVIKGGRGIRVEPALRGRIFGQDQLVGFSADLSYSVTRTETFWPYFAGREQLLKDRVKEGVGVLILEEAPLAGIGRSPKRKGIEGTLDAFMKLFGY